MHTHTEVVEDNGGELAERVGTRWGQRDSLLRERRETLCPLEADRDQVSSVVSSEFEGESAADRCTRSLGGMEAPEPMEVTRFPSVIAPVCVVSKCVFTSVAKCVLRCTHSVGARACVRATACVDEAPSMDETPSITETPCVSGVVASVPGCVLPSTPCVKGAPRVEEATCASETARMCEQPRVRETPRVSVPVCVNSMAGVRETARVSERPSVRGTACVRSLCVREMTVGMREHAAASPWVSVMEWCVSVVTCRCAWIEWRRRRRRQMDKGRVAAVAISGTAPGLHGGEREVRAVQRTRPPRARLRE